MRLNKILLLLFSLYGCSNYSDVTTHKEPNKDILNFYYSYLNVVEKSLLDKEYKKYYSKELSVDLEESIIPVTNKNLGWVMASSYMPKKLIEKYFIGNRSSENLPTCFSLIGKSFDGNPMFINFSLVQEEQQWKFTGFTRQAFIDGVEPTFPNKATCSENT